MKRRKYLGISLTKEINNLYPEFMRQRVKQLKGGTNKRKPSPSGRINITGPNLPKGASRSGAFLSEF